MRKLVTPILMTLAVMFGYAGTARALPPCIPFCSCDIPCAALCTNAGSPPATTCRSTGKCQQLCHGGHPAAAVTTPLEALTHFVEHPRQACVAGDDDGAACDTTHDDVATAAR